MLVHNELLKKYFFCYPKNIFSITIAIIVNNLIYVNMILAKSLAMYYFVKY